MFNTDVCSRQPSVARQTLFQTKFLKGKKHWVYTPYAVNYLLSKLLIKKEKKKILPQPLHRSFR